MCYSPKIYLGLMYLKTVRIRFWTSHFSHFLHYDSLNQKLNHWSSVRCCWKKSQENYEIAHLNMRSQMCANSYSARGGGQTMNANIESKSISVVCCFFSCGAALKRQLIISFVWWLHLAWPLSMAMFHCYCCFVIFTRPQSDAIKAKCIIYYPMVDN